MDSEVAKNTCNYRSLRVSLLDNYAAIKLLLQQQLSIAITLMACNACDLSGMGIAPDDVPRATDLPPERVPVYRLSDHTAVLYRSAIAFKIAPLWQLPVRDIANQLVASFLRSNWDSTDQIYLDFSLEVLASGWIDFRLNDQGLATWLQHRTYAFAPPDSPLPLLKSVSPDNFFPLQYAHARCCSLLGLAHTQGLIELRDLNFNTVNWQLVEPNPIPWLNDNEGGATGQVRLRLVHPAEQRLIAQILDVQDVMSKQSQRSAVKLATALSKAFEKFYSSCRIWGEVKSQTPKLAQARLGLVLLTQALLRSLLEDYLGVPAPAEL